MRGAICSRIRDALVFPLPLDEEPDRSEGGTNDELTFALYTYDQ